MKIKTAIRKIIKAGLIIFVLVLVCVSIPNLIMYFSVKNSIIPIDEIDSSGADCILVLGAGVRDDGSPSNMLEDRLKIGIELYNNGASDKLLMSGDHGSENYNEVGCMKNYALDCGVSEDNIFLDHAGFSTYESIYRAKEIFGAENIIIVTQEYHLYRALYIAEALNINAIGVSADLRTYIGQSVRETREIAARAKDYVYTIIKPAPTYLGEKISLEASGTVTDD